MKALRLADVLGVYLVKFAISFPWTDNEPVHKAHFAITLHELRPR
jgi:hypothetical protein